MSISQDFNVTLVEPTVMRSLLGPALRVGNTVVTILENNGRPARYIATDHSGGLSERNQCVVEYIDSLLTNYGDLDFFLKEGKQYCFLFQGDDNPIDERSVSWQSQISFENICLVPDFYYTKADGYRSFLVDGVRPWEDKEAKIFWRGSTTGGWNTTVESLHQLARYKLCQAGLAAGPRADFGFYNVVQARTPEIKVEIELILQAADLLKAYVPLEEYSKYKFFVQIDGNGNSWELVKKLRLGSCMLLVDSNWILFHNSLLRPWEHYIPVKSDLSDVNDIFDWCLTHDAEARQIAANGRNFAITRDYDSEMRKAAKSVYEHSQDLRNMLALLPG